MQGSVIIPPIRGPRDFAGPDTFARPYFGMADHIGT